MTAAEKLYQLIQTLPESQINEIFHFAESLQPKQLSPPSAIPLGTLTGLRGIVLSTSFVNPKSLKWLLLLSSDF